MPEPDQRLIGAVQLAQLALESAYRQIRILSLQVPHPKSKAWAQQRGVELLDVIRTNQLVLIDTARGK